MHCYLISLISFKFQALRRLLRNIHGGILKRDLSSFMSVGKLIKLGEL